MQGPAKMQRVSNAFRQVGPFGLASSFASVVYNQVSNAFRQVGPFGPLTAALKGLRLGRSPMPFGR